VVYFSTTLKFDYSWGVVDNEETDVQREGNGMAPLHSSGWCLEWVFDFRHAEVRCSRGIRNQFDYLDTTARLGKTNDVEAK